MRQIDDETCPCFMLCDSDGNALGHYDTAEEAIEDATDTVLNVWPDHEIAEVLFVLHPDQEHIEVAFVERIDPPDRKPRVRIRFGAFDVRSVR